MNSYFFTDKPSLKTDKRQLSLNSQLDTWGKY